MMISVRQCLLALAFATLPLSAPLAADDALQNAQSVITQQIQAFLSDDADKAYGFASPAIRSRFPDKNRFFDMVRKSYAPVYHPGNYAFGRSKVSADGSVVLQEVLISVSEGKDWTAVYELEKQPDGTFRINGVQMLENKTSQGI